MFDSFVPFNAISELIASLVIVVMIPTSMILADITWTLAKNFLQEKVKK